MTEQDVNLPAAEFIALCRGLSAAGPAFAKKIVSLRFRPAVLEIEGEMGAGVLETDGNFSSELRVSSGALAKAASLHRKRFPAGTRLHCVLDRDLGELRLPLAGLKVKFLSWKGDSPS